MPLHLLLLLGGLLAQQVCNADPMVYADTLKPLRHSVT